MCEDRFASMSLLFTFFLQFIFPVHLQSLSFFLYPIPCIPMWVSPDWNLSLIPFLPTSLLVFSFYLYLPNIFLSFSVYFPSMIMSIMKKQEGEVFHTWSLPVSQAVTDNSSFVGRMSCVLLLFSKSPAIIFTVSAPDMTQAAGGEHLDEPRLLVPKIFDHVCTRNKRANAYLNTC